MSIVKRVFVEKKGAYDIESKKLFEELKHDLHILGLNKVKVVQRYDVQDVDENIFEDAKKMIFAEPPVDNIYDEEYNVDSERYFVVEYLPGQYDQRADSLSQCIQILSHGERPKSKAAKLILLYGVITQEEFEKIKEYVVNPVESHLVEMKKYNTLDDEYIMPDPVEKIYGFINIPESKIDDFISEYGFAMDHNDMLVCQKYFRDDEKRDPYITELRILDTYWSDHCRHTTFLTEIDNVEFDLGYYNDKISDVFSSYLETRDEIYKDRKKDICLMDIATLGTKKLKNEGLLNDLDESEEINACSINIASVFANNS